MMWEKTLCDGIPNGLLRDRTGVEDIGNHAAETRMIRMMLEKTLCDGIPNGLLRDRTGVEDIGNHLGEIRLRWLEHLERMDETNLVKRVREERVPGHMKRGRQKKSGMRW